MPRRRARVRERPRTVRRFAHASHTHHSCDASWGVSDVFEVSHDTAQQETVSGMAQTTTGFIDNLAQGGRCSAFRPRAQGPGREGLKARGPRGSGLNGGKGPGWKGLGRKGSGGKGPGRKRAHGLGGKRPWRKRAHLLGGKGPLRKRAHGPRGKGARRKRVHGLGPNVLTADGAQGDRVPYKRNEASLH
jgi:hypothetical protein